MHLNRPTRRSLLLGVPVLLGGGLAAWLRPVDETTDRDREPLPPPPEPPLGSRPTLRSADMLAGDYGCAKPTVAADRDGRVLIVAMDGSAGGWRLVRWRSDDGGRRWAGPTALQAWPGGADVIFDPWLQTDHRGRFYLVRAATDMRTRAESPAVFGRSLDGGVTWDTPSRVAELGDRPVLAVSPGGRLLVMAAALMDPPTVPRAGAARSRDEAEAALAAVRFRAGVLRSVDRGRTWGAVTDPPGMRHAIPFGVACDDDGRAAVGWVDSDGRGENSRSVVTTTADGGGSWHATELAGRLQPDRNHPFNGGRFPVLALGGDGGLNVAFVAAGGTGLWFRSSRSWRTWESAVRLSAAGADEVRFPAIAAGGRVVHVTWMERRGERYRVWYRGSADLGATWSDPLLLSRPPSAAGGDPADGFEVVSDDQPGLADDGAGAAHAVWVARGSRHGGGDVWHAVVKWEAPAG